MIEYQEGQEVEIENVFGDGDSRVDSLWYKAKIVHKVVSAHSWEERWLVEFQDGNRDTFVTSRIRYPSNAPWIGEIAYLNYGGIKYPIIYTYKGWEHCCRQPKIDLENIIRDRVCEFPKG